MSLSDLMIRLGVDCDSSLLEQAINTASSSPLKNVLLFTHDEDFESPYFRQVGFRDFYVELAGAYDIGDPGHRPSEYADSFDDLEEDDEEDSRRVSKQNLVVNLLCFVQVLTFDRLDSND